MVCFHTIFFRASGSIEEVFVLESAARRFDISWKSCGSHMHSIAPFRMSQCFGFSESQLKYLDILASEMCFSHVDLCRFSFSPSPVAIFFWATLHEPLILTTHGKVKIHIAQ